MSKQKKPMKDLYSFALIILAIIVAVIIFATSVGVEKFFSAALKLFIVAVGFGVVILVHEFGHFLLAKLNDIHVEAFSIGFPPVLVGLKRTKKGYRIRILPDFINKNPEDPDKGGIIFHLGKKAKPGETEYRFGLIPFGGFVKMLGQEDTKAVQATDDPRSYANKSVWQRMSVIAAGVIFNVISAAIIFMIVFMIGIERVPPIIGGVQPETPAAKAGLKPGDEILEIDGKSYNIDFSSISMAAALSDQNEPVNLKVKHTDGSIEEYNIVPEEMQMMNAKIKLFGFIPPESLQVANVKDINSLTEHTGLKPGDIVKAVNGKDLENRWDFDKTIKNIYKPRLTVLAERQTDGEKKLVETKIPLELSPLDQNENLAHIYGFIPRLKISTVAQNVVYADPNDQILNSGDIILSVADIINPTYKQLRDITQQHSEKELTLKVQTTENGKQTTKSVTVIPQGEKRVTIGIGITLDTENPVVAKTTSFPGAEQPVEIPPASRIVAVDGTKVKNFYDIVEKIQNNQGDRISIDYRLTDDIAGAVTIKAISPQKGITAQSTMTSMIPFRPLERVYKADGPLQAVAMGTHRTFMFVKQAYVTLQRAVSGQVSPKNFMGPIGIISVSWQIVSERSLVYYAHFLGLISAFIAVFNFLPILPFDGGHIVFLAIEKIKGSPVSEKVQEFATYIGLALVGILFIYVTFNDIIRSWFMN